MAKIHTPKSRQKPACGTCAHFNATSEDGGECRRYPPQAIIYVAAVDTRGQRDELGTIPRIGDRFPGVRKADIWCGEYRAAAKS